MKYCWPCNSASCWAAYIIIMKSLTFFNIQIFQNFHLGFLFSKLFFSASLHWFLLSASFHWILLQADIFSFSFKAMSFFDDLVEELNDDFLLPDFLETSFLEQTDALCFMVALLSSSESFIQLWISWIIACLRPSQIVCIIMTTHAMCMQTALHIHKNLGTVLIPTCKNNLNLQISHTEKCDLRK